jgi:hypothetical protein
VRRTSLPRAAAAIVLYYMVATRRLFLHFEITHQSFSSKEMWSALFAKLT